MQGIEEKKDYIKMLLAASGGSEAEKDCMYDFPVLLKDEESIDVMMNRKNRFLIAFEEDRSAADIPDSLYVENQQAVDYSTQNTR